MDGKLIDALHAARRAQTDAARPDVVARVGARGRMTARERILALLDPDSAVEYGAIAAQTHDGEWIAEAGGVDFIGSIGGQTVIASSTDYTDHGGGYGAGRLGRLFALAHEHRWPVVFFVDGGGSRARHPRSGLNHIELSGPIGRFTIIDGIAELSGWVPTVAIVSGPSFAGHASLAGFSDFLIATRGSSIGMGGPPMVEAALGKRLSAHELAPTEMHEITGGIDLLVDDEPAAIVAAKRYLAFYRDKAGGEPSSTFANIDAIVPDDGPYDMRAVIEAMADGDSVFELRPCFAPGLITALARLNGRTIGIMANQPLVDDGAIDEHAAAKIARFIELCDAYEYPIVALIDTPGCICGWRNKAGEVTVEAGMTRWHARPLMAHQHRSVPLFSVQIRRGAGLGPSVMSGFSSGRGVAPLCLAWPTVEVGRADGFSAVHNHNAFDDIVTPAETRERIVRMLRHIHRTLDQSEKKHPIDTW